MQFLCSAGGGDPQSGTGVQSGELVGGRISIVSLLSCVALCCMCARDRQSFLLLKQHSLMSNADDGLTLTAVDLLSTQRTLLAGCGTAAVGAQSAPLLMHQENNRQVSEQEI